MFFTLLGEKKHKAQLAFSSFKVRDMFNVKAPVPFDLRSRFVYKFSSSGCNACYIGETCLLLSMRIREHLTRDRTSHIFYHLQQSDECRKLCSLKCFSILNSALNRHQVFIEGRYLHQVGESNIEQAA